MKIEVDRVNKSTLKDFMEEHNLTVSIEEIHHIKEKYSEYSARIKENVWDCGSSSGRPITVTAQSIEEAINKLGLAISNKALRIRRNFMESERYDKMISVPYIIGEYKYVEGEENKNI